nr:chemokine-like protein TAFA-5 isoform X6 [Peromyscus maniculatus bairdii]
MDNIHLDNQREVPKALGTQCCHCSESQQMETVRCPSVADGTPEGLLTIAAPAVPLGVAVAPWRLYTSAAALHPSWTPPVLHLPTVSQRPDKDSPIPRSPELKSVQLNPGGQDSDTQGVVPGISNTWYVEPGRTHPP